MNKNTTQGIAPIIAIIIGLIIGAVVVIGIVATQKKAPVSEEPLFVPEQIAEEKAVADEDPQAQIQPQAPVQLQLSSECGLIVTSPAPNQTVTFPLTITGTVEAGLIGGCRWGVFEGEAGTAAIYDTNGNKRSDTVILTLGPNWMSPGAHPFTVTIPALTSQPYTNQLNLIFKDNDPRDPSEAEPSQLVIHVGI